MYMLASLDLGFAMLYALNGLVLMWLYPNKAIWELDVTTQDQAHGRRQAWQSLELDRLTWT